MKNIFLSESAYPKLKTLLLSEGSIISIPESSHLYDGIRDHVDLHIHVINGHLFLTKEIQTHIEKNLDDQQLTFQLIDEELGTQYPNTAYLNAVSTSSFFIHNPKTVSTKLVFYANKAHLEMIPVKQGYTRCSLLPLDHRTFLTADSGIYKKLSNQSNLEIHLIDNGSISLPGQESGFFPGCCGVVGNTLYINGDLSNHPSADIIQQLCEKCNLRIIDLPNLPLRDIGSIITYERTSL